MDANTSLEEIAARVSQALDSAGIRATLSGGAAVSIYSEQEYESADMDFVTSARNEVIARAIAPLGFGYERGRREFIHPNTEFYLEFPSGPLAFGETVVSEDDAAVIQTKWGPLRIVTPTQVVMDRLAASIHFQDPQTFDQAALVARRHPVDWRAIAAWSAREGAPAELVERLKRKAAGD